jgi:membrane-bound lytic murein transglycosylase D
MHISIKPTLLSLLLLLFGISVSASSTHKTQRRKGRTVVSPIHHDTVYIIKYIQGGADTQPLHAGFGAHGYADYTPELRDSLLSDWYHRNVVSSYDDFFNRYIREDSVELGTTDAALDSLYVQRLRALVSPLHLTYDPIVRNYISRYIDPRYGTISYILGLARYYFPMIEEELIKAGLPVELRALPIIESALNPTAVSHAGAAGLWQFMPATAKLYGLEVNSLIDERYDPLLATRAACRYLKEMHDLFGDWMLAIASYNCGPGNVNKAIARSGGGKTFWDIYDYLPRETRGYVPAFIGATYAYAYHRQHGISSIDAQLPLAVDTIQVTRLMHLGQVASTLDLPIEMLRLLNPQYRIDIVPATNRPYTLILPQQYACRYISNEEEIQRKDSIYLKEYLNPTNSTPRRPVTNDYVTYTVRKGDTVGSIARRYHTTQKRIMQDNHIRNANTLRIGQKLKIRRS